MMNSYELPLNEKIEKLVQDKNFQQELKSLSPVLMLTDISDAKGEYSIELSYIRNENDDSMKISFSQNKTGIFIGEIIYSDSFEKLLKKYETEKILHDSIHFVLMALNHILVQLDMENNIILNLKNFFEFSVNSEFPKV